MTIGLIGKDYASAGCIKITKGSLDPAFTLDSDRAAFLFNSNWDYQIQAVALDRIPYTTTQGSEPSGSSPGSATHYWYANTGQVVTHVIKPGRYANLDYLMPLVDIKPVRVTDGHQLESFFVQSIFGYQGRGLRWDMSRPSVYKDYRDISLAYGSVLVPYGWLYTNDEASAFTGRRFHSIVWNLPGDETATLDAPAGTPVPGQVAVEISSTQLRCAKRGYDVRFANKWQMAFDANNRPVKVVKAGDVFVPGGASEVEIGLSLPVNTVVDLHLYRGSVIYSPVNPADTNWGVEYWIEGSKLKFYNASPDCRARYMILAFDDTPPTSGVNDVLHQEPGLLQFLRPGSGSPPAFADIVVDSRWPAMQMLAQGYIPVSATGYQTYTVPIDATSMFPFVKFRTVHGAAGNPAVNGSYGKAVRQPQVAYYRADGSGVQFGGITGDSCYCTLSNSEVVFSTHLGAPIRAYFNNAGDVSNNAVTYDYDPAPIVGIRYYVFGLAQP